MPAPADKVYAWHVRPGALRRLLPAWEKVRAEGSLGGIGEGERVALTVPVGPLRVRWTAEHKDFREGESFQDVQVGGPFDAWEHTHRFESQGPAESLLEDRIRYRLPLGAAGDRLGRGIVQRRLERMFAFRHERTRFDLLAHERHRMAGTRRFLVSGAGGLVGSELTAFLTTGGHDVCPLSRREGIGVAWSPDEGRIETSKLGGYDAVIHLAGEPVMGRWNTAKKRRIRDSRVNGTRLLCESLAGLRESERPAALVCASATGFYGDRCDEILTEESPQGSGFLADVCQAWEEACEPARSAGIRVVNVRIGLVLTAAGGVLGTLLPIFKAGLGGRVGSGRQWMAWITIDDLIDILYTAAMDVSLAGAVNATAPHPVANAEFARTLGRVLRRPTRLSVPALAVKAALGRAADELALVSARAVPERLLSSEHPFRYAELEPALRFLLGR